MDDHKTYYRRYLPHWQPRAATVFITFSLVKSLPRRVLLELEQEKGRLLAAAEQLPDPNRRADELYKAQRIIFGRWDLALVEVKGGPEWLLQPEVAETVIQSLRRVEDRLCTLEAYCVMPNHVHVVLTPGVGEDGEYRPLAKITQAIKGSSAAEANRLLDRSGQFWQHESYDHVVRDGEELDRVIRYVLGNPVKAGLVTDWRAWPWSYTKFTPRGL